MPLLERTRVEVYIPDLPSNEYQSLIRVLEAEFTYAFGGSSVLKGRVNLWWSVRTGTTPPLHARSARPAATLWDGAGIDRLKKS